MHPLGWYRVQCQWSGDKFMEHQEVTELFLLRQVPQAKHQSGSKPVSVFLHSMYTSYLRIDLACIILRKFSGYIFVLILYVYNLLASTCRNSIACLNAGSLLPPPPPHHMSWTHGGSTFSFRNTKHLEAVANRPPPLLLYP